MRAGQHAREEARLLLRTAEARDHPGDHVVDRQERGGGGIGRGQFLEDQRGIQPRQAAATSNSGT